MSDLGRFQLGGKVLVTVVPAAGPMPDSNPICTVANSGMTVVASLAMSWNAAKGYFQAVVRVGPQFGLGTYTASVAYKVSGVSQASSASFTVVGGGDASGPVISLYAYDRPEARYVLAQLGAGKLVQGRNPKL